MTIVHMFIFFKLLYCTQKQFQFTQMQSNSFLYFGVMIMKLCKMLAKTSKFFSVSVSSSVLLYPFNNCIIIIVCSIFDIIFLIIYYHQIPK